MRFHDLFGTCKPVIGMLHCGTFGRKSVVEVALEEAAVYLENGLFPLVENYYGSSRACEAVLSALQKRCPGSVYGVNILGDDALAFELADRYGAAFVQVDSVCGHLLPRYDESYAVRLAELRAAADVVLLGGVRFKYRPVRSGRTLVEDLRIGAGRCDAVVCTGEGTGIPTPLGKVVEFKDILGDFPVVVGAGLTAETAKGALSRCDGAIVGSWLKVHHRTDHPVDADNVRRFVEALR